MSSINQSTHRVLARTIGAAFLVSIFVGGYGLSLMTGADVSTQALQTMAPGDLDSLKEGFTFGAALDVMMMALSAFVAIALYYLLRPVNAAFALIACLLRLLDTALTAVSAFLALKMASVIDGRSPLELASALNNLATQRDDAFHLGLALSSIGAAIVFALLYKARFIPRVLAGYGVFASLNVTLSIIAMNVTPSAADIVYPAYVIGNAVAFIGLTLWLLVFGVNVGWWNERPQDGSALAQASPSADR